MISECFSQGKILVAAGVAVDVSLGWIQVLLLSYPLFALSRPLNRSKRPVVRFSSHDLVNDKPTIKSEAPESGHSDRSVPLLVPLECCYAYHSWIKLNARISRSMNLSLSSSHSHAMGTSRDSRVSRYNLLRTCIPHASLGQRMKALPPTQTPLNR
ncbi:hypothetical protein DAEQUDRAFT_448204 [Daedalea quercina L-15889]|uniref:Uncharacterized protein n=1 Tax=Daedalea quercina L-15889 TaxID=1314783 RepID=A0A165N5V9_9APHY|nr:hypothetical protein DAEQUDRAFT_448204 [Daedalea quercina L-15889]